MQLSKEEFIKKVSPYFPAEAIDFVYHSFSKENYNLKISPPRKTKHGCFIRYQKDRPQISVNCDLCSYEFLFVFLHELAHYQVYNKRYGLFIKPKPHGPEWQKEFKELLTEVVQTIALPEDIKTSWKKYLTHITSTRAKEDLDGCFAAYRPNSENECFLKLLKPGEEFAFMGNIYRLERFARTRVLCLNMSNKKKYLISGIAKVETLR